MVMDSRLRGNDRDVCRGAKPFEGVTNLQIRNPERGQGLVPSVGLGVSPRGEACFAPLRFS